MTHVTDLMALYDEQERRYSQSQSDEDIVVHEWVHSEDITDVFGTISVTHAGLLESFFPEKGDTHNSYGAIERIDNYFTKAVYGRLVSPHDPNIDPHMQLLAYENNRGEIVLGEPDKGLSPEDFPGLTIGIDSYCKVTGEFLGSE
ncbi:MAG: hypothetical protein ACMXYE_00190 [Candidatus Woesearchaeota archaeon]